MSPLTSSPLARSLLALAATLAVATADTKQKISSNCAEMNFGIDGDSHLETFTYDLPCSTAYIALPVCELYMPPAKTCGAHIQVCNPNSSGAAVTLEDNGQVKCNDPSQKEISVTVTTKCCHQ